MSGYEGHKTPKVLLYRSPEPITSYSSLNSGATLNVDHVGLHTLPMGQYDMT